MQLQIILLRVTMPSSVALHTTMFQFVTLPDAMKHTDVCQKPIAQTSPVQGARFRACQEAIG
jgi:hypothetical protein